MTTVNVEERRARKRLRDDFPLYARKCLKIRAKSSATKTDIAKAGAIRPFVLNRIQRHLHERIEKQLKRTGKVRVLFMKRDHDLGLIHMAEDLILDQTYFKAHVGPLPHFLCGDAMTKFMSQKAYGLSRKNGQDPVLWHPRVL
ncbi:MAG: hypothetical protein IH905_16255 [Proteobacteria bacterium]|nr:hypothetical protein [Pseudomonadota bacterium]